MPRKQKKYNYIYKTTCDVTNRYYIGMHSTDNLEDGYMGSGKRLWNSFNYHGKENHSIEVLEYLPNRKELKKREAELVNEDTLKDEMCMNLTTGGQGGFHSLSACTKGGYARAESTNRIMWEENPEKYYKIFSDRMKKTWEDPEFREKMLKVINWEGRNHSEETKERMSKLKKGTGKGENNSQYGTCWIRRNGQNKKIKKDDLEIYLEEGWLQGRKIKTL